jgi:tRNA(adenine34) deaminase
MQALTAAMNALGGKYLPECTIYVTVEPCVMCAGALAWSQIGRVVYGTADPKKGYSTYSNTILHPKTVVEKGLMEEECREVMEQFFKKLRR